MNNENRYKNFNGQDFIKLLNNAFVFLAKNKNMIALGYAESFWSGYNNSATREMAFDNNGYITLDESQVKVTMRGNNDYYTLKPHIHGIEVSNTKFFDDLNNKIEGLTQNQRKYLYNLVFKCSLSLSKEKIHKLIKFLSEYSILGFSGRSTFIIKKIDYCKKTLELIEHRQQIKRLENEEKDLLSKLERNRLEQERQRNLITTLSNKEEDNKITFAVYRPHNLNLICKGMEVDKETFNVEMFKGFRYFSPVDIKSGSYDMLCAICDFKVIGVIKYNQCTLRKYTNVGISYIDVNKDYQNQGIATKLLENLNKNLKEYSKIESSFLTNEGKQAKLDKKMKEILTKAVSIKFVK